LSVVVVGASVPLDGVLVLNSYSLNRTLPFPSPSLVPILTPPQLPFYSSSLFSQASLIFPSVPSLLGRPTLVGKSSSFTHELSFFCYYQPTVLSSHAEDGHQMYFGRSVVGE